MIPRTPAIPRAALFTACVTLTLLAGWRYFSLPPAAADHGRSVLLLAIASWSLLCALQLLDRGPKPPNQSLTQHWAAAPYRLAAALPLLCLAYFLLPPDNAALALSVAAAIVLAPLVVEFLLLRARRAELRALWRHHDGRPVCPHCNYDLTANTSGTCPECGNAAEPNPDIAAPPQPRHPAQRTTPRCDRGCDATSSSRGSACAPLTPRRRADDDRPG